MKFRYYICDIITCVIVLHFLYIAARIREILENVGLAQEGLPANAVASSQVLANVSNLLNVRDTELSSFLVAMGDVSLRKTGVEDKRAKVQKESKILLDYTRKAIARLTYLKRTLAQLEDDVAPCEAQMESWKTNLSIMVSKERQYLQQYSNYKFVLVNDTCPKVIMGVSMSFGIPGNPQTWEGSSTD
ncbi:HAUS augmin-like complex subunit 1 [Artemisia annua]|uniref:HAUS augmin-like complex subunit 1 n=1 Tax=Artemisia annua TaxID=35608 RepID=A0A2U1PRK0_ARTAN|nr:HAUS augmin-like complex subunit 1 [Artemisia annua]